MAVDHLRIASRGSELALAQARWVGDEIRRAHPGIATEIVPVVTTGDLDRLTPVATLTEVGAFVRAVQQAVLEGRADVAVHSCKDLPVAGSPDLQAIYPVRETPWDVLCGATLHDLARGARVGTGSPRRAAQLTRLRPDVVVEDVRGNVDTRLGKVESGEVDAVVLAEAGLRRIGRTQAIGHRFGLSEMVPAPGQAALALEVLIGSEAAEAVAAIDDEATRAAVEAERAVLAGTGAGCRSALGALAEIAADGSIGLAGFVADARGARASTVTGRTPADAARRLIEELGL